VRRIAWVATAAVGLTLATIGIMAKPTGPISRLRCDYVIVNLKDGFHVRPERAKGDSGSESFEKMVARLRPYAAVTGTYFDDKNQPIGDMVADGKMIARGCQRQGIGFAPDGRIVFRERRGRSRIDWSGCRSGIACGPRLLRSGRVRIDVVADGFSKAAETKKAWRCAVGSTRDGKLLLCVVRRSITLTEMAGIAKQLGGWNVVNMDGGPSCGLYADGRYAARPVVEMSNILAVYGK